MEAAGDPFEIAERLTRECDARIGHATAVVAEEESEPEPIQEAAVRAGLKNVGPEETFCFRVRKRGSHRLTAPTPQLEFDIGSAIWLALQERDGKPPKVRLKAPDVMVIAEVLGPVTAIGIIRKAWKPPPVAGEEGAVAAQPGGDAPPRPAGLR